jgi:hypothetical protein
MPEFYHGDQIVERPKNVRDPSGRRHRLGNIAELESVFFWEEIDRKLYG